MKTLSYILIIAGISGIVACDDEIGPVINDNVAPPAITSPSEGSTIVMSKTNEDSTTVFTWSAADFGVPVGVLYTLQASKQGENFANPVDVVSVNALGDTLTFADFNSKMIALEANMDVPNTIDFRVRGYVPQSDADTVYSDPVTLTVSPYTAKDHLYLVGQHNGWNNATANVMYRGLPGLKYELYVYFDAVDQGFKLLPTLGSWDGDIGDDPANPGHLIADGEQNMTVANPGMWKITVDLQAMTWTALETEWSLIGDFNNWAGDHPMTWDPDNQVLTATVSIPAAGGLKFRANADWQLNLGDTGADGTLKEGGDNIMIPEAGTYTITLNLNPEGNPQAYTYTVTKN